MSKIEKMSIMGVRSFGPEDSDRQNIQFFSPLTLILGANGTGKTTIIEALKYITTGDLPPNSKGGAFVHDPKVAHETLVRAQVRLQFRDLMGNIMQVQRAMEATQKAKNIQTRTLDNVITRYNQEGDKVSITSKCADLDREMVTALGVSKAVLESVIFCHQEDSCWPLSEGKNLKDKFDAIFASTRYTKVLECIRKQKQSQDQDLREYRAEMKHLQDQKSQAQKLEGDVAELETKLEATKVDVMRVEQQLQPIVDRLSTINHRYHEVYVVQTKIESLKSQKKQIQDNISDLQINIECLFKGSTEELEKLLLEFDHKVGVQENKLGQMESHSKDIASTLADVNQEKSTLLLELGKLGQEEETHEDNVGRLDVQVRKLAGANGIEGFKDRVVTEEHYREFLEQVHLKLSSMSEEGGKLKASFEKREQQLQNKMDDTRDKKTQIEQTLKHRRLQTDKNMAELRQIEQKLNQVSVSFGRLDSLVKEIRDTENELLRVEGAVNHDKMKAQIDELDSERRMLDKQMDELNSEMNRLHLHSTARTQLDMLTKERSTKNDKIRRIMLKHEETLLHVTGSRPSSNIRGILDGCVSRLSDANKKCSLDLRKTQALLSQKETEKNMLSKLIREKENEQRGLEDKVRAVCGSQDYEEGMTFVKGKVDDSQNKRGYLVGAEHFFKKYYRELEKDNPCCPLCHREFDTEQEVRELLLELEAKLRLVPGKLESTEDELRNHQSSYNSMVELRPIKDSLLVIRSQDLPTMKLRLEKMDAEVQELRETIEEKNEELSIKEADEQLARDMLPDIVEMDRYQGDIRELDKKITSQSGVLSGRDTGRTLGTVLDEKEDVQAKLTAATRDLNMKRQALAEHSDSVHTLRSRVNNLQAERLRIESELQQRMKLEEIRDRLLADNTEHSAEIRKAEELLRPLMDNIDCCHRDKDLLKRDKETVLCRWKDEMDSLKSGRETVKEIHRTITVYMQSGKHDRLRQGQLRKAELHQQESRLQEEEAGLVADLNQIRNILANHQIKEREMQDNLHLRRKEAEVEMIGKQIIDMQSQLGGVDANNLEKERQKLTHKDEELKSELNRARVRRIERETEIKKTRQHLNSELLRDASRKYRDKMIELRTTEIANSDLEKYYKAMDRAIMNYHTKKMAEINMIIRELWTNTYRGNDIDTIEIRSDDDDTNHIKTRRIYNYRVVMIKGDTVLDMRGRCSAGQKMLSSIVIRLALAETFCMNCGVIALDEPTSNLDSENIDSLAHALVRIINSRTAQRSFQLIVITHDEDFVQKLGRSRVADHFWRVFKDDNGISRLRKVAIEDMGNWNS